MHDSLPLQIFNTISGRLLNPGWLAANEIDGYLVKRYLDKPEFLNGLEVMVNEKDYSSRAALQICRPLLDELAKQGIPSEWLCFAHRYIVDISFPRVENTAMNEGQKKACTVFLEVLRVISEFQKNADDGTWQSRYPMNFLTIEEEDALENPAEYHAFLKAFKEDHVYEMMKLNQEALGYNSLDHICGVHYLALFIGRQARKAGLPIDLARVSGAAAGHDIGKFFCKGKEMGRVPYLHYYYTDQWFKKHGIQYIRHIAINHSTWDLELENLSLESLILIYSDFRVKNLNNKMHVFTLQESFDIILQKLDNVDEAKEKRYRHVYAKLKDFEDYLMDLGICVDPDKTEGEKRRWVRKTNYSLLQGKEVIDNIKYLAINHNIHLMYQLRDEFSSNALLELARSEKDWRNLRTYLRIFEEYSTYMTQKQKENTIKFLYELLVHSEDDVRRHCAEIIGILISLFDEEYRKEVPEGISLEKPEITALELFDRYLKLFIAPDHKILPQHRRWIEYSLSNMVDSLFRHAPAGRKEGFLNVLLRYYHADNRRSRDVALSLLDVAKYVPVLDEKKMGTLFDFVSGMMDAPEDELRIAAWESTRGLLGSFGRDSMLGDMLRKKLSRGAAYSQCPSENYLKLKIALFLNLEGKLTDEYLNFCERDLEKMPDMFLSNLKTATPSIIKKIQAEVLLEYAMDNPRVEAPHTAMHFCNLLKVGSVESVRGAAGAALVQIVPSLSLDQRNDIVVELLRALEIRGYQYTEIPHYLGRVLTSLPPMELDEAVDDFIEQIKQSNPRLISLLLKTIGVALVNYLKNEHDLAEDEEAYLNRFVKMLGVLLNGLGNYNSQIKQGALSVIGKEVFGSPDLNLVEKNKIFRLIAKKLLTLLTDNKKDMLTFLTNAAGLNHIYRFIADYSFFYGDISLKHPDKVAFFPGAFDPYSLSHKEITTTIRNMGFEVYLQVDEFSWSKQTLPNILRRNIINMSVADELNIYLYPEKFPANIVNPKDMEMLRRNFPQSEVYMVVGSDVVLNASAYRGSISNNSIFTFHHIIFERKNVLVPDDVDQGLEEVTKKIQGEIIKLALPPQYEDISSTQIRNYIDENRDISSLVDPLAEQYIFENGFYRREPQYKTLIKTISIDIDAVEHCTQRLEDELQEFIFRYNPGLREKLHILLKKPSAGLIIVRDAHKNGKILGFSLFHSVRTSDLFFEFKNNIISEYIRENAVGRIVAIDGIIAERNSSLANLPQNILNETLTYCLGQDFHYAAFTNAIEGYSSPLLKEMLRLHGFRELPYVDERNPVFVVNMNAPCPLTLNIEDIIKEPLRSNPNVKAAISRSRKKLQKALAQLYPGNLVLTYDINLVHESLVRKICEENGVPTEPTMPRKLGPAMCVPFGNILNRYIVPNTVTKALHTERLFAPDVKSFRIFSFPHYLSLENQIKMLRSFNRPVILVDDLLHKGYRIKALDPLLKKENIKVQKIFVGILSGRGKELMDSQNRKVDGAYFIPRVKGWFNEDILYPFIGGDTLWRGVYPKRNLLPSVNLILPYMFPAYMKNASNSSIYSFSQVCIENSRDILSALESEYLALHGRTLTLAILGEAFIAPRCPDHGLNMKYDLNLSPSHYLENDLEQLRRMESFIK